MKIDTYPYLSTSGAVGIEAWHLDCIELRVSVTYSQSHTHTHHTHTLFPLHFFFFFFFFLHSFFFSTHFLFFFSPHHTHTTITTTTISWVTVTSVNRDIPVIFFCFSLRRLLEKNLLKQKTLFYSPRNRKKIQKLYRHVGKDKGIMNSNLIRYGH